MTLQQEVDPTKWGRFSLGVNKTPDFRDALAQYLPSSITSLPVQWPETNVLTGDELMRLISDVLREIEARAHQHRHATATSAGAAAAVSLEGRSDGEGMEEAGGEGGDEYLDLAFPAIQFMNLQTHIHRTSSVTETRGIRIIATGMHLDNQVDRGYVFAYRIRVENHSAERVQLVGRHWNFIGGDREVITVPKFAPGVVGQQPQLKPGAFFEYVSGVHLKRSPGSMHGALMMRNCETNEEFEAQISTLALLSQTDYAEVDPTVEPERTTCEA